MVGLDRLSYSGNLNRISEILTDETRPRYTVQHHDLRSAINESLEKQLGQFDYIIHVAASSHVDRSIDQPINFVLDNVVGTCNVLDFSTTSVAPTSAMSTLVSIYLKTRVHFLSR